MSPLSVITPFLFSFHSIFFLSHSLSFFFFLHTKQHRIPGNLCPLSGQQEAKLKTNNFWISTGRQSECRLRSRKKRKKKRGGTGGGETQKKEKPRLRDLEGSGSGGAKLPRLMWEVCPQPAGMLSGTSH